MLLFFTTTTTFYYCLFRNQQPFTRSWWGSLLMTGVCIGCVTSVKWVGFFTTALVGLMTVEELWTMMGNVKLSKVLALSDSHVHRSSSPNTFSLEPFA